MRILKIIALGILMTSYISTNAIQIQNLESDQVNTVIEMILQCAYELWPINTPFDEFKKKNLHEFKDITSFITTYFHNSGTFKVLMDGDKVVGAGAIRKIDDEMCELKRMWFLPEYRGKGLGKMMADQLLTFAEDQSYKKIRLDVYYPEHQQAAVNLYKKLGFYEIPPYNNAPAGLFMEKEL